MIVATRHSHHTDFHDIAEDKRTISDFGNAWRAGLRCGVFLRSLDNVPSHSADTVASRSTAEKRYIAPFTRTTTISMKTDRLLLIMAVAGLVMRLVDCFFEHCMIFRPHPVVLLLLGQ